MAETDPLYDELKPDLQAIATPLLAFSRQCIEKRGEFLPHGAVLAIDGELHLCAAAHQ